MLVARVLRPQGRRGEVLAEILTDFPQRFADRKILWLLPEGSAAPPRQIELESHWLHKQRVVLKLRGVDSIGDAESLRGMAVAIPAEERTPLEGGVVYVADLIGCRVTDAREDAAVDLGEIVDVERQPVTADLLVVRTPSGEELLIPFAQAYLRAMDLPGRQVVMQLPEGLTEINAPMSEAERAELAKRAAEDHPE